MTGQKVWFTALCLVRDSERSGAFSSGITKSAEHLEDSNETHRYSGFPGDGMGRGRRASSCLLPRDVERFDLQRKQRIGAHPRFSSISLRRLTCSLMWKDSNRAKAVGQIFRAKTLQYLCMFLFKFAGWEYRGPFPQSVNEKLRYPGFQQYHQLSLCPARGMI